MSPPPPKKFNIQRSAGFCTLIMLGHNFFAEHCVLRPQAVNNWELMKIYLAIRLPFELSEFDCSFSCNMMSMVGSCGY